MAFLLRKPHTRVLCGSVTKSFAKTIYKSTTDEVVSSDAISEFTDELLSKRQLRWEIQQQRQNNESTSKYNSKLKDMTNFINLIRTQTEKSGSDIMFLTVDFEKLDQNHIDHLVLAACRDKNNDFIEKFVDQCVTGRKVISEDSVLILCEYLSSFSDNRTMIKLIELCKLNNRIVYDQNCEFKHFIAKSLWEKGNSDGALTLLDETYQQASTQVRKSIRLIFRFIIEDTVGNKSEAVLVRLIKSALILKDQLNEPMVLGHIWKICFLSSWFSDQVIADQLFRDNAEIRTIAKKRRGILCYNALCAGQVDVVHRLIEEFLKFNMKEECRLILELLFEYQYVYKNLRACSEILKTTIELDITLSSSYNHKLLNLLMGKECVVSKPKKNVIPKFDLKF